MIELRNVSKTYKNGVHALDHVNLTIQDAEFVAIIGLSGAGKSHCYARLIVLMKLQMVKS